MNWTALEKLNLRCMANKNSDECSTSRSRSSRHASKTDDSESESERENPFLAMGGPTSDPPVQIIDSERPKALIQGCFKSLQSGLYTDVRIRVGSRTFPAHMLVISSLSQTLQALLESASGNDEEITLHGLEPEDFEVLLHYAYTGCLNINKDNIQSILTTADYLAISSIKREIDNSLASKLDINNVCDSIRFASTFSLSLLWQRAMRFLRDNLPEVTKSSKFSQLDPEFLAGFFDEDSLILTVKGTPLKTVDREKLILWSVLCYLSQQGEEVDPSIMEMLLRTVRLVLITKASIMKCMEEHMQLLDSAVVHKYLGLREVAFKYLKQGNQDCPQGLQASEKGGKQIPDSWFRSRKPPKSHIARGSLSYAADGPYATALEIPPYLYEDPELEIEQVDVWIQHLEGQRVVGGLAVTYRYNLPTFKPAGKNGVDGVGPLRYQKGCCETSSVSGDDGDHFSLTLEPGESVVKVVISSGPLIDSLAFTTSSGRTLGPFGGPGGKEHVEEAPNAALSYLYDINCEECNVQGMPVIFNMMLRWIEFN